MTTSYADLPVVVDRGAGAPLAVQISEQVRAAVTGGVLHAGDRLPSSRDLAGTLGVSRTVISTAYARLFAEGWLEGRHGSGTYVANVAPDLAPAPPVPDECDIHPPLTGSLSHSSGEAGSAGQGPAASAPIELQPGVPWTAGIDQGAWRRAWRYAGTRPPSQWPDPHGLPALRAELAGYLRRSRGLGISPANILVTRGVAGGLALLAATLIRPGDKVGIEEPGYQAAHEVLGRAGARIVPCRVDAHGVVPDELPGDLRLLYTTPAHQYPLGGRLPVGRRQALTAWARAAGAIVVEDDYDSEFRYDVGPLPALYSMDPEVIVYLGTASKVLAPAFGAGWLVATPALVERIARLRPALGERVPEPVQHALLALLTSGDLDRHIRRMRLEYARRRAALTSGLTAAGPGGYQLRGDTAGMHLVLELTHGTLAAAEDLAAAAAANGVVLHTLDRYFAGRPSISGLVLGYGATPLTQVRRAAAILAPLLADLARALLGRRHAGIGIAVAAASGVSMSRACTWRMGEPVRRSMSIAPGPMFSQPGTCDAPKWPPRAHSARRRSALMLRHGIGWPAGQRCDTPHESSQLTIALTPASGPSVNGSAGCPRTPIWTQTRPSLFTFRREAGPQSGTRSSRSGAPSAQPARKIEMSCTMSPLTGSQTRWHGRHSLTSRCAADWMDTARGAVPRVSQTARGAPPLRGPPSLSARIRRAPGIHACATGFPSQVRV
jgi:GntR family transcriptional regulator / MocR family aminotransferase